MFPSALVSATLEMTRRNTVYYCFLIRASGQIKAHIARKGAPTTGWWGIVMLLYELPIHFNNPTVSRLTSFELETTPSSQHSCFAALAKNSHLWTVFTVLRTAASRPLHKGGKIMTAIAGLPFRKIREFCKLDGVCCGLRKRAAGGAYI